MKWNVKTRQHETCPFDEMFGLKEDPPSQEWAKNAAFPYFQGWVRKWPYQWLLKIQNKNTKITSTT